MYSAIEQNKRRTWVLVIAMSALIVFLTWIIGGVSGIDSQSSVLFGAIFATVYSVISYYISASVALTVSGAKQIEKSQAPDLFNVVENLCIANGQPMPKVYIIDDASPNAFATGRDPEHASIAFTTGILQILTREELEGVAAHELSHVKNYDIRVQTIVVVLVGLIALLANIFLRTRMRGGRDRNDGAAIFLIIGLMLSILSPIIAQLIQLAISRQREYLADASGALLTRYPEGLARALEKIAQIPQPLRTANNATAHLFIRNPFGSREERSWLTNLFATHPPIADRIARLRGMGR